MSESMDIGHGVSIHYVGWHPDRELNPKYADIPDVDRYGVIIDHPKPANGEQCSGFATFDGEVSRLISPDTPRVPA